MDLPADVHRAAQLVARDRGQSLSRTVSDLLRTALAGDVARAGELEIDPETGLALVHVAGPLTDDDVARLDED